MTQAPEQLAEQIEKLIDEIQGILYKNKTDEADEGSWIESKDFHKVAEKIATHLKEACQQSVVPTADEGDILIRNPSIHGNDYDDLIYFITRKNFNWESLPVQPVSKAEPPKEPDEDYFTANDEDDFQPCERCDGHEACRDFGCAFDLGLGEMVEDDL